MPRKEEARSRPWSWAKQEYTRSYLSQPRSSCEPEPALLPHEYKRTVRERTHKEPQHPRSIVVSFALPAASLLVGGEGGTTVGTPAGVLKAAVP